MGQKDKAISPFIKEIEELEPHEHICQIYSTPEEWNAAVTTFLVTGLRQGEKCFYIVDTHTADQVRALLHGQGIDVTAVEASGQLVISHESESYTLDGFFDPNRMIAHVITKTEETAAEGYHTIRSASEMGWVLRGQPGSNRLIEYEAKLNRDVFPQYPITGLCQYEWQKYDLPFLLDVICTHPIIMVGTTVYENPYYVPAAEFLNRKHSFADLQHWMDALVKLKESEEKEKQLRQELDHSRRLASIGELAAGVAHEINNPLTGIIGFSERLMRKNTDEKINQDLGKINSEARRMAKVVENLLTFARRREPKKQYADMNDVLQETLALRTYELKTSNIEVVTNLATDLPKIIVDFPQIQEVFLNIILNAEQAMTEAHGGGKLIIKTQQIKDYVKVSFTDDGPGIPDEHLDKLFDPFFTTRWEKGGTGLGLSACHSIVTEHGGKIYAKSKPGNGATFVIEFPLAAEKGKKV
ncbi:MAG: MEDS domain-containing protein [Deltaproteobacteria bacterium]|nr:MEDS domain-containing protein [Deltaproteobacteria bacterium]